MLLTVGVFALGAGQAIVAALVWIVVIIVRDAFSRE